MKKITYIFGAGASRGCLPIVTEFPGRMQKFINLIEQEEYLLDEGHFDETNKMTKRDLQMEIISDLKWMQIESSKHASVDTFAKKLYLRNQKDELDKLKLALSIFFLAEQARCPPDSRYDAFYASILNKDFTDFPGNLRILSWNYDIQFELAFREFSGQSSIDNMDLHIYSKYCRNRHTRTDKFCVFKLNGTTEILSSTGGSNQSILRTFNGRFDKNILEEIVRNFASVVFSNKKNFAGLSFAWETDNSENNVLSKALGATQDTSVLVIIGYSFPMFNREVDRMIIGSMKSLKKVYIQAPDSGDLAERFEAVCDKAKDIQIALKRDVGQFVLPNEL